MIVASPDPGMEGREEGREKEGGEADVASWRRKTDCSPSGRNGPRLASVRSRPHYRSLYSHYHQTTTTSEMRFNKAGQYELGQAESEIWRELQ